MSRTALYRNTGGVPLPSYNLGVGRPSGRLSRAGPLGYLRSHHSVGRQTKYASVGYAYEQSRRIMRVTLIAVPGGKDTEMTTPRPPITDPYTAVNTQT